MRYRGIDRPVDRATLELAQRRGKVVDLRQGPPAVPERDGPPKRAIPAAVKAFVRARYGDKCAFPGCPNRTWVEFDHVDGWDKGHDPERILPLCGGHHRARTLGLITVATDDEGAIWFYRRDGECTGRAGALARLDVQAAGAFARAKADPPSDQAAVKGSEVELALLGLRKLGVAGREAKALLAKVLRTQPELVRAPAGEVLGALLRAG